MVEISPSSSIDGKKNDSSVCVRTLARRFSSFSASNSSWKARSRLNACTIAMPATDSAMCAVTAAIRLRTSSCATEDVRWNQRVSTSAGGSTMNEIMPSRQSTMKTTTIAVGSSTTFAASVGRPCDSASDSASTSLVRRAMIQPARCSEKYRSDSEVRCSNRSRRSPSTIPWPTPARPRMRMALSTQPTAPTRM